MRSIRPRAVITTTALVALVMAGCSLFTDLGGATGGDDDAPSDPDAAASDAASADDDPNSSSLDGSNDTTIVVSPEDGGDATLPPGVLSFDSLDTSCATWAPYNATLQHVTDAYAGGGACKVCLTTTGVGGGMKRSYSNVGPGMYSVSGRVKNVVNTTDWRITVKRMLDGGEVAHYASLPLSAASWQLAETSTSGEDLIEVSFWFGNDFQAGDCALVDEVVVRKTN